MWDKISQLRWKMINLSFNLQREIERGIKSPFSFLSLRMAFFCFNSWLKNRSAVIVSRPDYNSSSFLLYIILLNASTKSFWTGYLVLPSKVNDSFAIRDFCHLWLPIDFFLSLVIIWCKKSFSNVTTKTRLY